jgi:hypothetical protein
VQVVATGLNQPRKVVVGPDGNLLVTEAGLNTVPTGCTDGTQAACANPSGAIARITPSGQVTTPVTGLPSINNGPTGGPGASGPSGLTVVNGQIQFLTQNSNIDSTTGDQTYGPGGALLGSLLSAPLAAPTRRKTTLITVPAAARPSMSRPSTPIPMASSLTMVAWPSLTPPPTTSSSTRTVPSARSPSFPPSRRASRLMPSARESHRSQLRSRPRQSRLRSP